MNLRALVLESDPDVADTLVQHLQMAGAERVDHAFEGPAGVRMAQSYQYALICTELLMPKLGGVELCKALRGASPQSALLGVTSRVDAIATLLGSEHGIDDYAVKPVDALRFIPKAQALIARPTIAYARDDVTHDIAIGAMVISATTAEIVVEGKRVDRLSGDEFRLVSFLARLAGSWVLEREAVAAVFAVHAPVSLKALGIDVRLLANRLRGPISGHRYLCSARRRLRIGAAVST